MSAAATGKASKAEQLEQIKADIIAQNVCPELAAQATQLVFGDGSPDADIVKYRPPNNRDPLPSEKVDFLPFLRAQLEVIQPKLVATLGRHSMDSLLPGLQISQVHGQPKRYKGLVFLPLFHPAAALYNGGLRQTLIDDFARIPAILKKI